MKLAIAPILFGSVAASSDIRAHSRAGKKLLHRARRLDGEEMSWAVNYSLKFEKCATSSDYYGGYFGGNNDNNQDNENWNGVYEQRLVHFKLCPTDSCSSGCSDGADYVIDMNEFVQAYLEHQAEAQEQECESVANNCYCENANDDEACEYQCYMNAGIYEQCVEQDNQNNNGQQEDEFELEEALECANLDIDEDAMQYYMYNNNDGNNNNYNYNGNNNNNNGQQELELFVGPMCSSNGKSINLGVFMDEFCSYEAPSGIYEGTHYGKALPYSSESIVSNDCISCMAPVEDDGNNNNNQNYYNYYNNGNNGNGNNGDYNYNQNQNQNQEEPEILEMCERLYEDAGKCESNLNVYGLYSNTMACDFIKGLGKTSVFSAIGDVHVSATPTVLAVLFGATTLVFGGVAYFFHKKLTRQSVGLVHSGGNMA